MIIVISQQKYRSSVHKDSNINLKLNHEIPVVFCNLKSYDLHLIIEKLDKFNLKINVIQNVLETYLSLTTNNKLIFSGSFQFLSSSLNRLVKKLSKNGFKYLSQEFDENVIKLITIIKLDIVKQKGFYSYECMNDFEKFKEELPNNEKFYNSLTNRKINSEKHEHVLNVWNNCEMKTMKDYHDLYLKCDILYLADVFKNLEIIA